MAKGSPGAILGIGTGVFLIGLAYTGRVSAVVDAALHGRTDSGSGSGSIDPDTLPGSQQIADCSAACPIPGYSKFVVQGPNEGSPSNVFCVKPGKTPVDVGLTENANGYAPCDPALSASGAGGQAFLDLVPTPVGGWAYKNQAGTGWNPAQHGLIG